MRETRGRLGRNVAFGAVLALLAGLQAGVTFSQAAEIPSFCHGGRLTLEGSTAFAPVAGQIGRAYAGTCPGAVISVTAISTFNGLNALNNAGSSRAATTQLAMSGGPAPGGYPALAGQPVAVIIFAIVVNKLPGHRHVPGHLAQRLLHPVRRPAAGADDHPVPRVGPGQSPVTVTCAGCSTVNR